MPAETRRSPQSSLGLTTGDGLTRASLPMESPVTTEVCAQVGVAMKAFSQPNFWMELILIYIVTFSARFLERSLRWLFAPNDSMLLFEIEAAREEKARRGGAAPPAGKAPQEMKPLQKDSGAKGGSPPI